MLKVSSLWLQEDSPVLYLPCCSSPAETSLWCDVMHFAAPVSSTVVWFSPHITLLYRNWKLPKPTVAEDICKEHNWEVVFSNQCSGGVCFDKLNGINCFQQCREMKDSRPIVDSRRADVDEELRLFFRPQRKSSWQDMKLQISAQLWAIVHLDKEIKIG